ncbi:MBL fold metallo-hydrolase [Flavobacteriaceae bacterium R38]|nr:MBL fold metallo-hydrolase [Flavobacteriaceae bacterium R38]
MKNRLIKIFVFCVLLSITIACKRTTKDYADLNTQDWIHGSEDCSQNNDVLIQVVQYNSNTWILRQNKCTHYEAPFMFLFIGEEKALLMDTGATESPQSFPLQKTVANIINKWQATHNKSIELVIAHTHSHSDHFKGDIQFKDKAKIVGLKVEDVTNFFRIKNWPEEIVDFDLGNRIFKIIPIPGHQKSSIAIYDTSSELLLTGDTFYPGRLYIEDWISFKKSIKRLVNFSNKHNIAYILGNHVEMSTAEGKDYPIGTTYQPEEHKLPLTTDDLLVLHSALEKLGDTPKKEVHPSFIIYPTK